MRLLPAHTLHVLVLSTVALVISCVAFAFGYARAAGDSAERRRTPVVRAVEHAAPAVVSVFADSRMRRGYLRRGAGSGVIVHPAGYVVTNAHVIKGGQRFHVQLFRGNQTHECTLVLNWPQSDLALLKINRPPRALPYVSLCRTCNVMLGETAIAVGNPRGLGDTITVGVVSAMNRDMKLNSGVALRGLLQTDASINNGNSGGALLNLDGELIGIIVSILPRASGIAFAIPCDQVAALLQRGIRDRAPKNALPAEKPETRRAKPTPGSMPESTPTPAPGEFRTPIASGSPGRPDPEIRTPRTSPLLPSDFGLHVRDTGTDIEVLRVEPDSRASEARLRSGDVLLAVDGSPVEDRTDLMMAFSRSLPGQEYSVLIRRSGKHRHLVLAAPR